MSRITFKTFSPRSDNPALRLICFPYAGGSGNIYEEWQGLIGSNVEVCAAQLPGRGARFNEPKHITLGDLLDECEEAILPLLDRPFAIFGHSLGAVVAFAFAQRLEKLGKVPQHLFVSGASAPVDGSEYKKTRDLNDQELVEWMSEINGTPVELMNDPELMEIALPILRADFAIASSYKHVDARLKTSATVFGGSEDKNIPVEQLSSWGNLVTGRVQVEVIQGDHFFIHGNEKVVITAIRRTLGL
ncbi:MULTISPECIES: thioesterase II family protein [Pseudomonas]|uniref:LgrE_2 protein n=2 Tax=Pseudomonas TaxID=286 RepID=A0A0D0TH84_PSEFL|nr:MULTISPECIES: alpha/beta fold hydrolase [Pseudomonas fluorescens group]AZE63469.1 Thioesterase [Pseudomonas synxantha]KIR20120.1 Linear gramicidin dehydrogenase LgrE [Pseudomonas fluorescens]